MLRRKPIVKRMPKEADFTREELYYAIFEHLSVILPDTFDDEDLGLMSNACVKMTEDSVNYAPRKKTPGSLTRKHFARDRATRGGLPVLTRQAHFALDGLILLCENLIVAFADHPEATAALKSSGNDLLGLTKVAKAWLEQEEKKP